MKKIAILCITILLVSCNTTKNKTSSNNSLQGDYLITALEVDDITTEKLTMRIDTTTNTMSGFSGCNTYRGMFSQTKDQVSIQDVASTKMYCPEKQKLEQRVMNLFGRVVKTSTKEETIVLIDSNGEIIITLRR